jgi:hypothetical protein
MVAVPSGELSSTIKISKGGDNENTAVIMASIFSFSLYVGIMTTESLTNTHGYPANL